MEFSMVFGTAKYVKYTAANAGHEYPAVMQGGGRFEIFKDQHGFVREAERFDDLTMLCLEHRGEGLKQYVMKTIVNKETGNNGENE